MGLFDNLMAPFSTAPQQNASQAQINALQTAQGQASPLLQSAYGALASGYGNAAGNLTSGYGQGTSDVGNATNAAIGNVNTSTSNALGNVAGGTNAALGNVATGTVGGLGALSQGYGAANQAIRGQYAQGLAPLTANYNEATSGVNSLNSLLGIGPNSDPASVEAALAATPGYQFTLDQGTQNVDRNAAATGSLNSGNTETALANYTTGLANQTYNQAVANVSPFLGYQSSAGNSIAQQKAQEAGALSTNYGQWGTGAANTLIGAGNTAANINVGAGNTAAGINVGAGNTAAGINVGAGNTLAGIDTGLANSLANTNIGGANALAGNLNTQAQMGYGTDVGIGNAQANAAMAPATAGANAWGLAQNLAKIGVSAGTGLPTGTLSGMTGQQSVFAPQGGPTGWTAPGSFSAPPTGQLPPMY